ncbi:MAG: FAD-dependent oxidoreductase [Nitrospirota bacterium]
MTSPLRSQYQTVSSLLGVVLVCFLLAIPVAATAHESWVLTPQEMAEWNAKPPPEIFTQLSATNIAMFTFTALFLVGWILLNYTGARELFPDLQVRLASYGGYTSLALRIALFVMLGMGAFGLGPRHGTGLLEAPTLAAPDLELRLLGPNFGWIAWIEAAIAFSMLLGVYVRAAAAALLVLGLLGLGYFGQEMLAYIGLVGGAAVYLLLQGAGSYAIPMPSIPGTTKIAAWLADQPRGRAQWLLRMMAGINLAYLGWEYKYHQPNLMMGIIELHHVPTLGLDPGTFVLWMALVETLAGLLIMAGVLMRPLSVVLFCAFVFFSAILGESVFAHIIFYGLLVSFITNGAGRWRRPVATDKPARVVILGGGFAGVHCAMRLERLLGEFTNVTLTLVHRESYFLFQPLLPEVVGGAVQAGNIVNPIRRLCPRSRFLQGEVVAIDHSGKAVRVTLVSGEPVALNYDQLIVALDAEANFAGIPGLLEHALPMMTIGDGLFLRQQVLERLEQAETIEDPAKRRALLVFGVVGGGLRGSATAAEIRELINCALVSYPRIDRREPRVLLFEASERLIPQFDAAIGAAAQRRLEKIGVEVFTGTKVTAVTPEEVVVASGRRIPCRLVVGALTTRPRVVVALPGASPDGRVPVDEFLRGRDLRDVTVIGECARTPQPAPFLARREIRMGRLAAYNALATLRGYPLFRWSERRPLLYAAALGRYATVGRFLGLRLAGLPAWFLSRLLCLLTLPGLERNVRVLLDWILDIPFRNDIVVLAPQRTQKLSRAHYEVGDEIVREGERGDCAYLLVAGEVEVLRQTNGRPEHIAKLQSGDCFGEIALLADTPRTATVKCLTPVDVVVLPRDQFLTLAEGYRDLGSALKARMAGRISEVKRPVTVEATTDLS